MRRFASGKTQQFNVLGAFSLLAIFQQNNNDNYFHDYKYIQCFKSFCKLKLK